jgi:glucose-6-phosphate isomerase
MESLGKGGQGITVYGNKGSTDQHAYVQQLREGPADFFTSFVRVFDSGVPDWEITPGRTTADYLAAFQEGTARALSEAGRPSLRITIDSLRAQSLGALIALYERTVGFYAAMIGINAYNQPGVEAGKKAADSILELQDALLKALSKPDECQSVATLARSTHSDVDLVFDILARLSSRRRYGISQAGTGNSPSECTFRRENT